MVKIMCDEAGIQGKKSNESLRVTGASSACLMLGFQKKLFNRELDTDLLKGSEFMKEWQLQVSKILTGEVSKFN